MTKAQKRWAGRTDEAGHQAPCECGDRERSLGLLHTPPHPPPSQPPAACPSPPPSLEAGLKHEGSDPSPERGEAPGGDRTQQRFW